MLTTCPPRTLPVICSYIPFPWINRVHPLPGTHNYLLLVTLIFRVCLGLHLVIATRLCLTKLPSPPQILGVSGLTLQWATTLIEMLDKVKSTLHILCKQISLKKKCKIWILFFLLVWFLSVVLILEL